MQSPARHPATAPAAANRTRPQPRQRPHPRPRRQPRRRPHQRPRRQRCRQAMARRSASCTWRACCSSVPALRPPETQQQRSCSTRRRSRIRRGVQPPRPTWRGCVCKGRTYSARRRRTCTRYMQRSAPGLRRRRGRQLLLLRRQRRRRRRRRRAGRWVPCRHRRERYCKPRRSCWRARRQLTCGCCSPSAVGVSRSSWLSSWLVARAAMARQAAVAAVASLAAVEAGKHGCSLAVTKCSWRASRGGFAACAVFACVPALMAHATLLT